MNPVLDAASKRALIGSFVIGAAVFFATIASVHDWWAIASATGAAICSQIIYRFGFEGMYDSSRAANGNVNAGDVPVASPKIEATKVTP